jgi:hypothetical protein
MVANKEWQAAALIYKASKLTFQSGMIFCPRLKTDLKPMARQPWATTGKQSILAGASHPKLSEMIGRRPHGHA